MSALLLAALLLFLSAAAASGDLAGDASSLLALRSAVGRSALSWSSATPACSWEGVTCDSGRVVAVRLPGVGLSGELPADALAGLTALRTLSLRYNALTGAIPASFATLAELRNLYLQHNNFSGEIPAGIFLLPKLIRLNLAGNSLSGKLPATAANVTRLGTLYLEGNALSGELPAIGVPLQQFNASFNGFEGSIPKLLRRMPRSSFLGMDGLCGGPVGPCPGEAVPAPASAPAAELRSGTIDTAPKKAPLSGGAIAGIVIGCAVALLIFIAVVLLLCCRRSNPAINKAAAFPAKPPEAPFVAKERDVEFAGNGAAIGGKAATAAGTKRLVFFGPTAAAASAVTPAFELEDLLRASAEVLGKGAFGTAYKAVLENGTAVAVKRLKDADLPESGFRDRIAAVGSVRSEHVVPLLAYYYSRDEKLLVYDYLAGGSLSALLHGNSAGKSKLDWDARLAVAAAAARGVEHIHSLSPAMSHGNIKSTNVLLTGGDLKARVSDHGLPTLAAAAFTATRVSGYRAPEVTDIRRVSQKADVYSFGVLLLELLTGKAPGQADAADDGAGAFDLPRWVQSVVREEWTEEVFDAELRGHDEEEMVQLLQLAMDCAAQHPDSRPTMAEVAARINAIRRPTSSPAPPAVDVTSDGNHI